MPSLAIGSGTRQSRIGRCQLFRDTNAPESRLLKAQPPSQPELQNELTTASNRYIVSEQLSITQDVPMTTSTDLDSLRHSEFLRATPPRACGA